METFKNNISHNLRKLQEVVANLLKLLFCTFVTGEILYTHYIFSGFEMTFQMKIFIAAVIILALANWSVLFSKIPRKFKTALIVLTVLFGFTAKIFPDVKYAFDYETCLDMNYCAEGLEINTVRSKMKINKENCLKYDYKWNDRKKYCDINSAEESLND